MANVTVEKVNESRVESPSLIQKLESIAERIRRRAYEIFEHRGTDGSALDDWLQAERDLTLKPQSELIEKDTKYEVRIAAPGFQASEASVTVLPDSVIVTAESTHKHEEKDGQVYLCEFGGKSLYRRIDLPKPISVDKVTASLDDGILRITAQKAEGVTAAAKAAGS